jgi:hypothetical protein
MPKVRALVPLTHPKSGEAIAAGTEVDVDSDTAADWRADGKVSLLSAEQDAAKAAESGSYGARTGREDVASTKTEAPKPKEKK